MLIHIVVWKYNKATSREVRDRHISRLRALEAVIPEIKSLRVGADILNLPRSYDTGLVAEFRDRDALAAYTVHIEHQKAARMGKEIASEVASVDFIT